jgi:hypothetical protein
MTVQGDPIPVEAQAQDRSQAQDRRLILGALVSIAGSALAIVGVLLPWLNGSGGAATQIGIGYTSSQLPLQDGAIFALLAVFSILACGVRLLGQRVPDVVTRSVVRMIGSGAGATAMSGLFIATFGILSLRDISSVVDLANRAAPGLTSIGIGIYLDIAAGLVMILGGGIGLLLGREQ